MVTLFLSTTRRVPQTGHLGLVFRVCIPVWQTGHSIDIFLCLFFLVKSYHSASQKLWGVPRNLILSPSLFTAVPLKINGSFSPLISLIINVHAPGRTNCPSYTLPPAKVFTLFLSLLAFLASSSVIISLRQLERTAFHEEGQLLLPPYCFSY